MGHLGQDQSLSFKSNASAKKPDILRHFAGLVIDAINAEMQGHFPTIDEEPLVIALPFEALDQASAPFSHVVAHHPLRSTCKVNNGAKRLSCA